jgi:hypothetical protein
MAGRRLYPASGVNSSGSQVAAVSLHQPIKEGVYIAYEKIQGNQIQDLSISLQRHS